MDTLEKKEAEALVKENLSLVAIVARQLVRELGIPSAFLEDMESAGYEGLISASRRFDASRGVPFRRFANHRVRGSMIDAMRRESALPRRAYERLRGLSACLSLNEGLSEDVTPTAVRASAARADELLAEHLANLATAIATGLVAKTVVDDSTLTALDPSLSPEESAERTQLRSLVCDALKDLPEQERILVQRHYFEGCRFDEVAAEMGLSKSWASRLHTRAIDRLTKRLRS